MNAIYLQCISARNTRFFCVHSPSRQTNGVNMDARRVRSCGRCGARLASDNPGTHCGACARGRHLPVRAPEPKPDDFWQRPLLAEALRTRHFGKVLYAYRYEHRPTITQALLGEWLGMTQAQVSRLERAEAPPHDLDKLKSWAAALNIPESNLWFRLASSRSSRGKQAQITSFGWFGGRRGAPAPGAVPHSVSVEFIRDTTIMFRQLDNRFGGGHARGMVGAYLATEVLPTLRSRHEGTNHFEFVGAVAELNQLAGWMAYDVGDQLSGRRHLQQGLQLCQSIGDHALSAEMLAGMSHQAAHVRNGPTSVTLAQAARQSAADSGVAALESETAVMEAHGLALLREKPACITALKDAESAFSRSSAEPAPGWLSYYDAAYLAAKMAHCFRELGELRQAERFARRSLEMSAGYERGRLFNTALLASILADLREVEEACIVGRDALRLAGRLQSVRTIGYMQDFAQRLAAHATVAGVVELNDELKSLGFAQD